jgi:hypothetical protein
LNSKFLLIFLFTFNLFAQEDKPLKDFNLLEEVSEELSIVVKHLQQSNLNENRLIEVTTAARLINNDVKKMEGINLLYLLKSEIYKGLLNNQYISYSDSIQISSVIFKSITEKMKKYDLIYSDMAKWIYNSVKSDLDPYLKGDFIDRYQTVSRTNIKEVAKSMELRKALRYISPWVIAIESKTPEEFNEMLSDVCVDILVQISKKTYFFKEFTSQFEKEKRGELFQIPDIKSSPNPLSQELPNDSVQTKAQDKKAKAKKQMETLENTQDLNSSSKAIDKLLEDENEWTPKQ